MEQLIIEFAVFCLELLFWAVIINVALSLITRYLNRPSVDEIQQVRDKIVKMIHFVQEEQHGDVNYWFDEQTDEFLAQGKNFDEIIAQAKARFPTHVFIINDCKNSVSGPDWKITPIGELSKKINV